MVKVVQKEDTLRCTYDYGDGIGQCGILEKDHALFVRFHQFMTGNPYKPCEHCDGTGLERRWR